MSAHIPDQRSNHIIRKGGSHTLPTDHVIKPDPRRNTNRTRGVPTPPKRATPPAVVSFVPPSPAVVPVPTPPTIEEPKEQSGMTHHPEGSPGGNRRKGGPR